MKDSIGFILAGGVGERLYPLTKDRAKPAVPFGGIYRIIDFTLSNCINSGLKRLFILTQYKSLALEKHIQAGWSVFYPELKEFIHFLPPQMRYQGEWYLGTADAVFQNFYSIKATNPKYVFILSGDHIYKMDYRKMLRFHKKKNSSLTIAYFEVPIETAQRFGVLELDEAQRVIGFQEKPENPRPAPGKERVANVSMGVYLFNLEVLTSVLMVDSEDSNSSHDFGRDIIPKMIKGFMVYGYEFEDENRGPQRYWRDVGTIEDYYQANMDLVEIEPLFNLYDERWPIRTFQYQLPPAKTVFADLNSERVGLALQSLAGQGVIISGGKVIRSILSPKVRINSYSEVSDSILFEGVNIGRYARVRRAIIDKYVKIPDRCEIGYNQEEDRKRFFVSETGIVVIPKGTVL